MTRGFGQRSTRRKGSVAVIVAIGIVVACLAAEVAAAIWYTVESGGFFYIGRPTSERPGGIEPPAVRLHPYWGHTLKETERPEINELGFGSPYEFPHRDDGALLIGIAGGSVAFNLASDRERFERILTETLGSKSVVLNVAVSGAKEPQSMFAIAYLLAIGQRFDAVVSIEGVDEIVGAYRNIQAGWSVSMPDVSVMGPLLEFLKTESSAHVAAERSYRSHLRRADECTLALCYYAHREIAVYRLHTIESTKPATVAPATIAPHAEGESVIDVWENSTRLLTKMLAPARYVSVIQPTPQYQTVRKMTDSERQMLANPASTYAPALKQSYPALIARASALPELDVVDMTRIFDAMPETAYVDDCCRLTEAASERMMRTIARALSTRLPPRDAPKPRR